MPPTAALRPTAAILYATDAGFALPTIASALQMRRLCPPDRADIRIVTSDLPKNLYLKIRDHLAPANIFVDFMPASLFLDFNPELYNKTHVPRSALARFFLLECIPDSYERILYLDGDTWPAENPSELLAAPLSPGSFAAAEDKSYFYQNEKGPSGRRVRAYFAALGIDGAKGYFNSGVLLADTAAWRPLSRDAYQFFQANTALCIYHDQSALNAVAAGRRLRLAPRWNFLSAYDEWGIHSPAPPAITHFAGGDKPWLFPDHPFAATFQSAFAALAPLNLEIQSFSADRLRQELGRRRWRHLKAHTIFRHRRHHRQKLFDNLIRSTEIG